MINKVIFDFDGTLADTRELYYSVCRQLARKYGLPMPTREEIDYLRTIPIRERLRYLDIPLHRIPGLVREALIAFREGVHLTSPFPGVAETLRDLDRHGIARSIVSSNTVSNILSFLTLHNLEGFEIVHGTAPIFGKHMALKRIVRELGPRRKTALYVGDELRDIMACRRVGLPIAAVTWGYDHRSLLESGSPDYLLDHPSHLKHLLSI